MAEDTVKRVTGWNPMFPNMGDMSGLMMPFSGRTTPDAASDAAVPIRDDLTHLFQHEAAANQRIREVAPSAQQVEGSHGAAVGSRAGRSVAASVQRVACLEHLQQKMCGGVPNPAGSVQWDAAAGWDAEASGSNANKQNNV